LSIQTDYDAAGAEGGASGVAGGTAGATGGVAGAAGFAAAAGAGAAAFSLLGGGYVVQKCRWHFGHTQN